MLEESIAIATQSNIAGAKYATSVSSRPPVEERLMFYELDFEDEEKRPWKVCGYKRLRDTPDVHAWRDTTWLFVQLIGESSLSAGIAHVDLPGFLKQIESFRDLRVREPPGPESQWRRRPRGPRTLRSETRRSMTRPEWHRWSALSSPSSSEVCSESTCLTWATRSTPSSACRGGSRLDEVCQDAQQVSHPNDPDSWRGPDEDKTLHRVEGFDIWLRRYEAVGTRRGGALLIHGASASGDTFLIPNGGLVRYLSGAGWEVWTLDWRGSCDVVATLPVNQMPIPADPKKGKTLATECSLFTVDKVADEDIKWAVKEVRDNLGAGLPIAVVGHCFGSGALAIAVARGHLEDRGVTRVVFSTLSLFYEVTWNGGSRRKTSSSRGLSESWLARTRRQSEAIDPFVDRGRSRMWYARPKDPVARAKGPGYAWPKDMEDAYRVWPEVWLPPGRTEADEIFKRLTFMFGQPYLRDRLASDIHGPLLGRLFGGMHLGLYLHAGQMVRRGFAGKLDEGDLIDRPRLAGAQSGATSRWRI